MALDPNLFFYSDGTITLTNGSDIATGDLVAWDPAVLPFDFIFPNDGQDGMSVVKEVLAVNQIRLAKPWTGPTLTAVPYFMVRWVRHTDPRVYALRVSDYLARLKGIPENIEEFAAEISADAAAVAAAMTTLAQIEANVDADRQASQTAAGAAQGSASAAAGSAQTAQQWVEAASTGVVPDNGVTNAKLADVAVNTIKGRVTAGTGDPEDLTATQVKSLLGIGVLRADVISLSSPAATIDLNAPAGARLARIHGVVPATGLQAVWFRVRLVGDSPATFRSGASDYNQGYNYSASATSTVAASPTLTDSKVIITFPPDAGGSSVPLEFQGQVTIKGRSRYRFASSMATSPNGTIVMSSGGYPNATADLEAIRFMLASGSFPSGTFVAVEWY